MKIEYLVGIDYGDGETTAAIVNINGNEDARSLQIAKGSAKDQKKVDSAIVFKEDSIKGKIWRLPTNTDYVNAHLETHFKRRPEAYNNLPLKLEAFKEFVSKIFERIWKNNSELEYDPATGKKNFLLYVACPSKWALDSNDNENVESIIKYKDIISTKIPVDAVIKESDAAFFHFLSKNLFNSGRNYLVIDYGSSTIDYTYYQWNESGKSIKFDGSDGHKYGAAKVEQCWLEHIKKTSPKDADSSYSLYQSTYEYLRNVIKETFPPDPRLYPNIESGIRHKLKAHKEDYYSRSSEDDTNAVDTDWEDIISTHTCNFVPSAEYRLFFNQRYTSDIVENEVLFDYKKDIEDEFIRIRDKSWTPDNIMITGGASRMGWVNPLVRKVFEKVNPSVKVQTDTETASYVVAFGIVSYMRKLIEYRKQFPIKKNELLTQHCSKGKLESLLADAINSIVKEIFINKLREINNNFISCDHNLNYLASNLDEYASNLGRSLSTSELAECNAKIAAFIANSIKSSVERIIHNSFKSSFKLDLYINTKLDFTNIITSSFQIDAQASKFVKQAACPYVCLPWETVDHISMYKERTDTTTRIKIANSLESIYKNKNINIDISSSTEWKDSVISNIEESIKRYLEEAENKWPFDIY